MIGLRLWLGLEGLLNDEQNVSRVGLSFGVATIPGGQGFLDGLEFGQSHGARKIIKFVPAGIPKHPRQPAHKLQLKASGFGEGFT